MSKATVMTPEENDSENSKPNFFSTPKSEHTKSDCCGCVRWSSSKKSFKPVFKDNSAKKKLMFEDLELEITPQKQNLNDIFQEDEDEDRTWDDYSVSSQTGSFDGVEDCIQLYLNQKEREKLKKDENILQTTNLNKTLHNLTKLFPECSSHITKSIDNEIPPDIIINNRTDNNIENNLVENVLIESSSSLSSSLPHNEDYHDDYDLKVNQSINNDDIISNNNSQENGISIDDEDECTFCDCEQCDPHFRDLIGSRMLYNSPILSPHHHFYKDNPMINNYKIRDKLINKNYKMVNRLINSNYNNLYNVYGLNEEVSSTHHNTPIKHSPSHTYKKHIKNPNMYEATSQHLPLGKPSEIYMREGGDAIHHEYFSTSRQELNRLYLDLERKQSINLYAQKGRNRKKDMQSKKNSKVLQPNHALNSHPCKKTYRNKKRRHSVNLEDVIQDLTIQTKEHDSSNENSGKSSTNNNLYNTEEEANDNGSFIINNDEENEDNNDGDNCVLNEEEEEEDCYIINCYGRMHNNTIESHCVKKVVACHDCRCYEENNRKDDDTNERIKDHNIKIKIGNNKLKVGDNKKNKQGDRVLHNGLDNPNPYEPNRYQQCCYGHGYHSHQQQQNQAHSSKQHFNKYLHVQHHNNNQVNTKAYRHINTKKNSPTYFIRNMHKEKDTYPHAHNGFNTHTYKHTSNKTKKGTFKNTNEMSRRVVRRRLCRISKYIRKKNKKLNNKSHSSSSSNNSKNNNNNSASATSSSSYRSFVVTTLAQI